MSEVLSFPLAADVLVCRDVRTTRVLIYLPVIVVYRAAKYIDYGLVLPLFQGLIDGGLPCLKNCRI